MALGRAMCFLIACADGWPWFQMVRFVTATHRREKLSQFHLID